jgi:hypothetical protein
MRLYLLSFYAINYAINKKHQSGNLCIVFDVGRRTKGVNAALVRDSL